MPNSKADLIEAIQQLPDGLTMRQIVARLTDQFIIPTAPGEPAPEEQAEANWAAVINMRMEEMLSGDVAGVPAEEVLQRRSRQPR